MIRQLQPKAMINNCGFDDGDFGTLERDYKNELSKAKAFTKPTEACQGVGMQSWGYRKNEDYYADRYLKMSIYRVSFHVELIICSMSGRMLKV